MNLLRIVIVLTMTFSFTALSANTAQDCGIDAQGVSSPSIQICRLYKPDCAGGIVARGTCYNQFKMGVKSCNPTGKTYEGIGALTGAQEGPAMQITCGGATDLPDYCLLDGGTARTYIGNPYNACGANAGKTKADFDKSLQCYAPNDRAKILEGCPVGCEGMPKVGFCHWDLATWKKYRLCVTMNSGTYDLESEYKNGWGCSRVNFDFETGGAPHIYIDGTRTRDRQNYRLSDVFNGKITMKIFGAMGGATASIKGPNGYNKSFKLYEEIRVHEVPLELAVGDYEIHARARKNNKGSYRKFSITKESKLKDKCHGLYEKQCVDSKIVEFVSICGDNPGAGWTKVADSEKKYTRKTSDSCSKDNFPKRGIRVNVEHDIGEKYAPAVKGVWKKVGANYQEPAPIAENGSKADNSYFNTVCPNQTLTEKSSTGQIWLCRAGVPVVIYPSGLSGVSGAMGKCVLQGQVSCYNGVVSKFHKTCNDEDDAQHAEHNWKKISARLWISGNYKGEACSAAAEGTVLCKRSNGTRCVDNKLYQWIKACQDDGSTATAKAKIAGWEDIGDGKFLNPVPVSSKTCY